MRLKHQYGHLEAIASWSILCQSQVCMCMAWRSDVSRHPMRLQEQDHGAVVPDICSALVW